MNEVARDALQQIKDKDYVSTQRHAGVRDIFGVGVAVSGKRVSLASERLDQA